MKVMPGFSLLLRFGGRRASFKVGVIATLAIAVAANIAVLGNLGVLFGRVVPGAWNGNLLAVSYRIAQSNHPMGMPFPVYDRLVRNLDAGAEVGAYKKFWVPQSANHAQSSAIRYLEATPSLAGVLGITPVAGRMFTKRDTGPGSARVAVIAGSLARARFGSAADAIDRHVELGGERYRVVGVLPSDLAFPPNDPAQAWIPLPKPRGTKGGMQAVLGRFFSGPQVLIHPAAGTSAAHVKALLVHARKQAVAQLSSGTALMLKKATHAMGMRPKVKSLARHAYGSVITKLKLLELAALLLFLLVLANLARLVTADNLARRHEFAAKAAIGAGAIRMYAGRARELLFLGIIGWAIGIGLGWLGSRALSGTVGQAGAPMALTAPVLLITLAAVAVVMVLLAAGGIRRLHTPRHLLSDLMGGGRTTGGKGMMRALRALIVLQLAVSVILLVVARHFRANVATLSTSNLGFNPSGLSFVQLSTSGFTFSVPKSAAPSHSPQMTVIVKSPGGEGSAENQSSTGKNRQPPGAEHGHSAAREILARLQGAPGVKSAAALSTIPLSGHNALTLTATAAGVSKSKRFAKPIGVQPVSPGIVEALGLEVLAGNPRAIFHRGTNAIFVGEKTAQQFFPKLSPAEVVGKSLDITGSDEGNSRIVAVVASLKIRAYAPSKGQVFKPLRSVSAPVMPIYAIRSSLHGKALRALMTNVLAEVDPAASVVGVDSASSLIAKAYAKRIRLGRVFGVLAVVALLIAAVGLFALLAYRSLVRRPEFAIRGALGATPGRLLGKVLGEAGTLWVVGCAIGVPAAYGVSVLLASYLPKLGLPASWVTIAVVIALGIIALIAAFVPARRAAGTDLSGNLSA